MEKKAETHKLTPASYLVLIKEGKILLLRRHNTGYQDGKYSLVAGHVESGETFTNCIIREAREEANIVLKPADLRVLHIMHRTSETNHDRERIDVFFTADKWAGEPTNNEPDKCSDLSWFEIDNLPKNTIPYVRQAIKNIRDTVSYSEFGWKKTKR